MRSTRMRSTPMHRHHETIPRRDVRRMLHRRESNRHEDLALRTDAGPADLRHSRRPVWALGAALEAASDTSFSRLHDLVLSPEAAYLYVSDVGNDAVQVLDPMTLRTLGTIGPDELDSPHDVVFDARGRLLVADTGNDRVAVYEVAGTRGKLVAELTGGLRSPEGVTVRGYTLWVSDTYNNRILRYRLR